MVNNGTLSRGTASFTAGAAKFGTAGLASGVYSLGSAADAFLSSTGVSGGAIVGPFTMEGWVKTTATSIRVCFGHDQWFWVGITAAGLPTLHFGATAGTEVVVNGTTAINDGAWHHLAFVTDGTTRRLMVDGNQVGFSTTAKNVGTSTLDLAIGGFNSGGAASDWAGSGGGVIDEVRISNTARYTNTTYTVPTAAFLTDANTTALYHLESDASDTTNVVAPPTIGTITVSSSGGTDTITYPAPVAGAYSIGGVALYEGTSSGAESTTAVASFTGTGGGTFTRPSPSTGSKFYYVKAYDTASTPNFSAPSNEVSTAAAVSGTTTTILPSDTGIVYSPYNWDVTSARAFTPNAGAYFRTQINGNATGITLQFDMTNITTPYPQIRYRIDQQPWVLATIASTIAVAMPTNNTWGKHPIEVVVKSATELNNRWNAPQASAVNFTGISVVTPSTAATTTAPRKRPINVLVFGDSITEGVRALGIPGSNALVPDTNDATVGWAYPLTVNLGAEVGCVGFGRQGVTISGNGNVPALSTSYALVAASLTRNYSTVIPDLILINMGTNDKGQGTSTAAFQAAYIALVNNLLAATPATTKIGIIVPFGAPTVGYTAADYPPIVAGCSTPSRVSVIDSTGWFSSSDASDGTHPYGYANADLSVRIATAAKALIAPASTTARRFINKAGTAVAI